MLYIKNLLNEIVEHEVKVDKEQIKNLKVEMLDKLQDKGGLLNDIVTELECGLIERTHILYPEDDDYYELISKQFHHRGKSFNNSIPENFYDIKYYKYCFHPLVQLCDRLIFSEFDNQYLKAIIQSLSDETSKEYEYAMKILNCITIEKIHIFSMMDVFERFSGAYTKTFPKITDPFVIIAINIMGSQKSDDSVKDTQFTKK
jgi:hypothetical protein